MRLGFYSRGGKVLLYSRKPRRARLPGRKCYLPTLISGRTDVRVSNETAAQRFPASTLPSPTFTMSINRITTGATNQDLLRRGKRITCASHRLARPLSQAPLEPGYLSFRLFDEFFTHQLRGDGIVPRDEITDVA